MSANLTIRDESLDRRHAHEWPLDIETERMSVRDIIRSRIFQEVDEYNASHPHTYRGLIQPAKDRGQIRTDWQINGDRQFELACDAFAAGRLVILVGDAQADTLEEEFDLQPGTAITFLRLAVIVGG